VSHNLVQLRRNRSDFDPTDNALQRLKGVMHERRIITPKDIAEIARAVHQPEATVFGVATYYGDLGLQPRGRARVKVCKGSACHAACADDSVKWLEDALGLKLGETSKDGAVSLEAVYCLGFCNAGPAVEIEGRIYAGLTPELARVLAKDLSGAGAREAHDAHAPRFEVHGGPAIVLERLAKSNVDARDLDAAKAHGVFEGLRAALAKTPEQVLAEVEASGLRGRGGAGFATATKWRFAAESAKAASTEAYVVCNADEGDPGSYIDKYIMERDPFAVLEGLAIAGRAIGAKRGFVYVRSEYPRSAPALRAAVEVARRAGILGPSGFDVHVVEGAGSYVCGEETALLRSIEGLRGMVTARPPYPAEKGLFEKPTVVNNVETLANLGWILRHGGAAYGAIGVGKSRGTKTFSLNGLFARPGIYEVPLGTTLRALLVGLGGGLTDGRAIKAIQIGGPLGGILPASKLDVPLGFEELDAHGALLGHGGVVVWAEGTDARDIAEHLLDFCAEESCGKCFPCRIGSHRGLEIARRLKTAPRAEVAGEVALLRELLDTMKMGSLCAHGGGIPDPIRGLLTHFEAEMTAGGGR